MSVARRCLESSALLREAGEEAIAALARRAELVALEMGKPFQRAGQLAAGVALVQEGRLRRVWNPPGFEALSLGTIEKDEWAGWGSALRDEPDLTLIASQPTRLVFIPLAEAQTAVAKHDSLRQALATPLLEELAVLLLPDLQRRGLRVEDPRALLEELIPQTRLLHPGDPLPEERWLCFSGPSATGLPPAGTILDPEETLPDLPSGSDQLPSRILALPEQAITRALGLEEGQPEATDLVVEPAPRSLVLHESGKETAALVAPTDAGGFRGGASSRVEQALICIVHLAASRKLAFSRDFIRKNLEDVEQRLGALKLPQLGLQLEALGFDTRPLRARAWDLARLEPPALLDLDGVFVLLLVAGGRGGVLIGDPREGLRRLSIQQLEQLVPEGTDLLVVRQGRAEMEIDERFGLNWFFSAFMRYPGLLGMTVFTAFISQLLEAVFPLGALVVIDQVIGNSNLPLLAPLAAILIVAAIASSVLGGIRALLTADLSDRVDVRMGSSVVEHLMRLPLSYFEQRQVGNILFNVNQLYSIRQFLVDQLLGVGLDTILAIIFLFIIFWISPTLTLVVISVVPLLALINLASSPVLIRWIKASNKFGSQASTYLYEVVGGMRTVKSQNFEVESRWHWLERYRKYTTSRFRLTQLSSLIKETSSFINKGERIALVVVAAVLILDNKLSIGALFAVRILSARVISPLLKFSGLLQGFHEMQQSITCLEEVMLAIPETGVEDLHSQPMPPIRGRIRFDAVTFRYGKRGRPILNQLDMEVEPGQFVGIVGLSGSGKSTLVQLIDRLYLPLDGHVYVDGIDVAKVQLASLRRRVGYVPQESLLFEGSVLDNIRLNSPDATIEAVIDAAQVAAAHDFIQELSNGYATRLGERGAGLSGGQRQRVCLARMVLQAPSLLILDEATSALDAETERQVCRNLARRYSHCTVLFITHRLTTLSNADRILFMDRGRIIEDGTHQDLMLRKGSYATLYEQQVGEV